MRAALAVMLLLAPGQARAQDPLPARGPAVEKLYAVDDLAQEAWLYGFRVLAPGYRGPSAAESQRALSWGARLIVAADAAAAALHAEGRERVVTELDDATDRLGEALCPALGEEDWPSMLQPGARAEQVRNCETTSDLVTSVREHAAELRSVLRVLFEDNPDDCWLMHRVESARVRGAFEHVHALWSAAASSNDPELRRELVAMLRDVRPDTRRAPAARQFAESFPAPLVERYAAAINAHEAATPDERPRTGARLLAAARALAAGPNALSARIASLRRSLRALEEVLRAWRALAPPPVLARKLAAARGDSEVNEAIDDLQTELVELRSRCPAPR